ncbi:rab3 GTPase-activating protein non-catalytic subunit-like [Clytia hemisphaerica]|uniref:rab3 GTPase-activating protein non-catalytic subunit-like n=1 Tax=Clytia hemisphaerica TaxID=252671 RepID=UPI0034D620BF
MSCALHSISQIHNVDKLQSLLKDLAADQQAAVDKGFDNEFVVGEEGVNNWDGDWGSDDDWVADASPVEALSPSGNLGKSWLHTCKLSLSPAGDLIAIAKDDKGIFLTRRWPKETTSSPTIEAQTPSYDITWSGDLTCEENEKVTCINAVPLASQQSLSRSSQGSPDWTCIIAGYSTGYIRMYMSNGSLLLSQFLHDGPVLNIVIRTKTSFASSSDQVDELIILYSKAIVTIDGFSLYQSLRACRNQLAKAQASYGSESIQPPPLAYKKWKSTGQKGVTDCVSCGVTSPCFFDRLQTASVIGGQQATVKGSSPAFNRFLSTGTEPFLCYYQALEGSNQPILSDVAMAYASKLTSAVFSSVKNFTMGSGWFGGGKQAQSPEKKDVRPNVERGTSLPARFGLFDQHRITSSVKLSPIGNLANCYRHLQQSIVSRYFNWYCSALMERALRPLQLPPASGYGAQDCGFNPQPGHTKDFQNGYRDAECGWIVVEEEEDQQSDAPSLKRRALFVVIYAPKRGILEIYLTEHGARVGAFNVGKNCKLICPTYQCLGPDTRNNKYQQQ